MTPPSRRELLVLVRIPAHGSWAYRQRTPFPIPTDDQPMLEIYYSKWINKILDDRKTARIYISIAIEITCRLENKFKGNFIPPLSNDGRSVA
jgi:hypothetical protein